MAAIPQAAELTTYQTNLAKSLRRELARAIHLIIPMNRKGILVAHSLIT